LRDILNLSREEIYKMNVNELQHAVNYAWTTYTLRRVDLPYRKKDTKERVSWNN